MTDENQQQAPAMPPVNPYQSEPCADLMAALAKAQGDFEKLEKTRTAKVRMKDNKGEYTYNYADLSDVVESVRTALKANGLAFTQDERGSYLWTFLHHSTGQWLAGKVRLFAGNTPQTHGSGLTYARRYGLCNLLGVVAEDDDDGARSENAYNRNSGAQNRGKNTSGRAQPKQRNQPPSDNKKQGNQAPAEAKKRPSQADYPRANANWEQEPCTDAQRKKLWAMAKEAGYDETQLKDVLLTAYSTESTKDLTKGQIQQLFTEFEALGAKK